MSPKPVDRSMREHLVEAAAQIIATDGLAGLTLRRLTREVGTSTMAIYTHFGSMDELRHAIRREGFARMSARFRTLEQTDDPVADLSRQGWAYWRNAVENPNLYRAMFMHGGIDDPRAAVGETTFDMLVAAVQRCLDAGRFMPAEPRAHAVQLWSMVHGICSLYLSEMLSEPEAIEALGGNFAALMAAFGDDADATRRSLAGATAA
jgi:AcrR family transcriptional regulator